MNDAKALEDWVKVVLGAGASLAADWRPTGEELADALWLARFLPLKAPGSSSTPAPAPSRTGTTTRTEDLARHERPRGDAARGGSTPPPPAPVYSAAPGRTPLSESELAELDQGRELPGREVDVPLPPALPDELAIARALKPLKKRVPSRTRFVLDEDATAERIAESAVVDLPWTPVLRPQRERWLEAAVVVDQTSSMGAWRPRVEAFIRLLDRLGAFRDVRTWRLQTDRDAPARLRPGRARGSSASFPTGGSFTDPRVLLDPAGRRLILVLTDAVTLGWRHGWVRELLELWGRSGPLAIVPLLPTEIWPRTRLGPATVRLHGWSPGAPNRALRYRSRQHAWTEPAAESPAPLPVPVMALTPDYLRPWARLVAGVHERRMVGVLLRAQPRPLHDLFAQFPDMPEDRVTQFRDGASRQAWALACRLAVVSPFSLSVARLVLHSVFPHVPTPAPLAELLLSGLVRVMPHPPETPDDDVLYGFQPGVRELLDEELSESKVHEVLDHVSAWIDRRAESPSNFRALLADPDASRLVRVPESARRFALIQARALRSLEGEVNQSKAMALESQVQTDLASTAADSSKLDKAITRLFKSEKVDPDQHLEALRSAGSRGVARLQERLKPGTSDRKQVEATARAALTLLRLERPESAWDVFRARLNPTARTELIHRCAQWMVDRQRLVDRLLGAGPTDDERMALILALGQYPVADWPEHDPMRRDLAAALTRWYAEHPHPGVHGGIRWLFRNRWRLGDVIERLDDELATTARPAREARWYVGPRPLKQTFVVVHAPVEFSMGSPESDQEAYDREKPQSLVRLTRTFAMAIEPVTQARYQEVIGSNPSSYKGDLNCPVETVSWLDAVHFCNKLSELEKKAAYYAIRGDKVTPRADSDGYCLPTEAEWEFTCRAGTSTKYGFGDDASRLGEYAWYSENKKDKTQGVGQKLPNDLGLFDFHGNVCEWCDDWFDDSLPGGVDPRGPERGSYRVNRGGGWFYSAEDCRSAGRNRDSPEDRDGGMGFRCAARGR